MSPSCSVLMNLNFLSLSADCRGSWFLLTLTTICLLPCEISRSQFIATELGLAQHESQVMGATFNPRKKQWVCRAKNQIMVLALCGPGVMWHMSWCQMRPMKSFIGRNGPMRIRKSSNSSGSSRQPYNCFPSIITWNINWGSRVIL